MIIVRHRVNTLEELDAVHPSMGIEFDVREAREKGGIVVTHDPWGSGPNLDVFLSKCRHAFYIVNVKCEGIEYAVLELLQKYRIENFFLLDCSFPMMYKLEEPRIAVRISEFEDVSTAIRMSQRAEWVWIDVFNHIPVTLHDCARLHELGYRICLVSPELQKQPDRLDEYRAQLGFFVDMVCTKFPERWQGAASLPASEECPPLASP